MPYSVLSWLRPVYQPVLVGYLSCFLVLRSHFSNTSQRLHTSSSAHLKLDLAPLARAVFFSPESIVSVWPYLSAKHAGCLWRLLWTLQDVNCLAQLPLGLPDLHPDLSTMFYLQHLYLSPPWGGQVKNKVFVHFYGSLNIAQICPPENAKI